MCNLPTFLLLVMGGVGMSPQTVKDQPSHRYRELLTEDLQFLCRVLPSAPAVLYFPNQVLLLPLSGLLPTLSDLLYLECFFSLASRKAVSISLD